MFQSYQSFSQVMTREYSEFAKMKSRWSAPFYDYCSKNIQPDITSTASWSIEEFKVYNPYSGVTTNQAESLNTVLKIYNNVMSHHMIG